MGDVKGSENWYDDQGDFMQGSSGKMRMSDHVFGGAIAVGYDFNKRLGVPVRLELEYALFSNAKAKSSDRWREDSGDWERESSTNTIGVQTLFANAYYDFHNSSAFTPYLGLGLGMAFVDMKESGSASRSESGVLESKSWSMGKKSSTNFAWNLGAGVAYAFTDNVSLDLGYRFVGLGKGKTKKGSFIDDDDNVWRGQNKTSNLYMHQVALGLRFSF